MTTESPRKSMYEVVAEIPFNIRVELVSLLRTHPNFIKVFEIKLAQSTSEETDVETL